nr:LysM peptidoglycan-binding domain-containing protein [Lysinibacillus timonensis]
MVREDYREKIEEHRQSIKLEKKPNSRLSRSRGTTIQKKKRRDPLMTTLLVIFIFIPLAMLVYVWGIWNPIGSAEQVQNEGAIAYETNENVSKNNSENEIVMIDNEEESNNVADDEQSNQDSELNSGNSVVVPVTKEQSNQEQGNGFPSSEPIVNDNEGPTSNENGELQPGIHIVQEGDTLFRIATNNSTTVDELMTANNLESPNISVGQQLLIP